MKRQRDAWVEATGTPDGSWLTFISVSAGQAIGDTEPPPVGVPIVKYGVLHHGCMDRAYRRIRAGEVDPARSDLDYHVEFVSPDEPDFNFGSPSPVGECPFCHAAADSDEDVYPRWLLRQYEARGAQSIGPNGRTGQIRGLMVRVCQDCNNGWMSVIERDVMDLALKLSSHTHMIDVTNAQLLATWATLKAILLDVAHEDRLIPSGFAHDLRITKQPHGAIRVWAGAYSDRALTKVSRRLVKERAADSDGHGVVITFTLARLVLQVFIPLVDGSLGQLVDFAGSVVPLWPVGEDRIDWPPPYYFDAAAFDELAARIRNGDGPTMINVTMSEVSRLEATRRDGGVDAIWLDRRELEQMRMNE